MLLLRYDKSKNMLKKVDVYHSTINTIHYLGNRNQLITINKISNGII